MKLHEIVHTDLSGAYAIQQFFDFASGGLEVELANGHLRPADGIADGLLQLLRAGFALCVAKLFQGTAEIAPLQPGRALFAGRDGRCLLPSTWLRRCHIAHCIKGVKSGLARCHRRAAQAFDLAGMTNTVGMVHAKIVKGGPPAGFERPNSQRDCRLNLVSL
jgi:hypothetical protein